MSGSTAPPLYNLPFGPTSSSTIMNNHLVEPSYSTYAGASVGSGDSTYLGNSLPSSSYTNNNGFPSGHPFPTASSSSGGGPSTQGPAGESTPGSSKRPFPWASGSGSQERDKRARSCDGSTSGFMVSNAGASGSGSGSGSGADQGNADEVEDAEDSMSTDESAYASAAESPRFNPTFSRSPTRVDTPRSRALAPVEEYADTQSSFGPAHNSTSHASYTYPDPIPGTSSVPRIPTPAALRSSSPLGLLDDSTNSATSSRPVPLRLASLRSPLPAARPTRTPSLSLHALAEPRGLAQYDISHDSNRNDMGGSHQSNTQELARNTSDAQLDLGWLTQQLDEALPPPRSLEPFSSSDPSASASSLFPATHPAREFSASFGSGSVDSALPLSTNRNGPGRVPLPWVDIEHEGGGDELLRSVSGSALSGDMTRPASPGLGASTSLGFQETSSSNASSPDFLSPEQSSIDARLASPTFDVLDSSPQGESVASTVRSENSPPATAYNSDTHTEVVPNQGHSAAATFGSSGSTRTSAGPARRPLSLNLRGFPASPTLSISGSRSFIESPTFPTSVSPRTSTFDLAVTPPGSALPSFVARMMEVDSPVREVAGGDRTSHAYTLSDISLQSQAENNTASIDALRRFVQGNEEQDASPNEALADVAVGYFPESSRQFAHPAHQSEAPGATSEHIPDNQETHAPEPSWTSRPSDLDSVYSRRLTESGVSYPSRPSDSGASLPSFRAAVSPGPELNMGSRPGRVVRDMSWSFSDLFRPHEGLEETPSGSGSEASLLTRVGGEDRVRGRAGVRNALSRAVGLPPRLHLDALPRIGQQDERHSATSTNLSRTPPALGPSTTNAVPAENWFEGSSAQARPVPSPPPRRMSATRWTDLLPEAAAQPVAVPMAINPAMRLRMPPAPPPTDNTFDSLSGSWNRGSVPYIDSPSTNTQPQDAAHEAAAALARYQTFAQSIEEIRRSPSQMFSGNLINTPATARNSGPSMNDTSARSSWAGLPRRPPPPPPPPFNQPPRARNPYALTPEDYQPPPAPTRSTTEFEPRAPEGNWLREWEMHRDRRSRAAREDYLRRRDTTSSNATEAGPSEPPRQGQMWAHRPRPMTRALLVGTGFADDDLANEWSSNGDNAPRRWGPPRRLEIVPPLDDGDSPMRFSSNADEDGMGGMLFTESPPSMLQDLHHDTAVNSYELPNPDGPQPFPGVNAPRQPEFNAPRTQPDFNSPRTQPDFSPPRTQPDFNLPRTQPEFNAPRTQPDFNSPRTQPDFNPPDFRSARHALRLSLDTTRRDDPSPSNAESLSGSLGRRSVLGLGDPPMRPRNPRDSWEPQTARSHLPLERVRRFLHPRSSESREREPLRRHPAEIGQPSPQPRRRSFLSALDTEPSSPAFSESTGSLRRLSMPWSRNEPASATDTQPFPSHENDHPEWPSTESSSRNEALRVSSIRRRRRTLLPESSARRDSNGFLHHMSSALNQVESGLLQLNALADESNDSIRRFGPQTETGPRHEISSSSSSRMDWAFDQVERNSSPPRLPPFNFSTLQQNSDWPASRRNQYPGPENPPPTEGRRSPARGLEGYLPSRQNSRDSIAAGFRYDYSWRGDGELWSNDVAPSPTTSMPLRDRLLFRASAAAAQPARQPERNTMPSTQQTSGRLHRRRPSPPAPPTPSSTGSLLRPFLNQAPSSPVRSYTSRFSHLLPRRSSGRGGGAGSSDDNDDWHPHPHPPEPPSSRRFFIRARGSRSIRGAPPLANGDFIRDEEFDDSYEGLLRLAARIGDVKPRGTPAEVIRSMPTCSYAQATGAKAESRCPICLDDYAQEDTVAMIKQCSHWFHRECIQQWLSNSRTCPVCRGQADGEGESEPQAGPSSSAPENSWM